MKITIESTDATVSLLQEGGVPLRMWKGTTEDGTEVRAYVALLQLPASAAAACADADPALREVPIKIESRESAETPAAGRFAFASDPRATTAVAASSQIETACVFICELHGNQALLDGLASVYIRRLIEAFGVEQATLQLDTIRQGLPAIARSMQQPGLGAMLPQGRA